MQTHKYISPVKLVLCISVLACLWARPCSAREIGDELMWQRKFIEYLRTMEQRLDRTEIGRASCRERG